MSMPQFTILQFVEYAWMYYAQNLTVMLNNKLRQLPPERQERYKRMIEGDENISVVMGWPQKAPSLPFIVVEVDGEDESSEASPLNDIATDNRRMPYPSPGNDDYDDAFYDFYGVTYVSEGNPGPNTKGMGEAGDKVRQFAPREKNLWQQRESGSMGDEQFVSFEDPQPIWDIDKQRLLGRAVGDTHTITISFITGNYEKTLIYHSVLKSIFRRFRNLLERNSVQDLHLSSSGVKPRMVTMPTGNITAYEQKMVLNFLHFDVDVEVEATIAKFIFDMDLATRRPDGTIEIHDLNFTAEAQAPAPIDPDTTVK